MENLWMAITAIATATDAIVALLTYLQNGKQGDDESEAREPS